MFQHIQVDLPVALGDDLRGGSQLRMVQYDAPCDQHAHLLVVQLLAQRDEDVNPGRAACLGVGREPALLAQRAPGLCQRDNGAERCRFGMIDLMAPLKSSLDSHSVKPAKPAAAAAHAEDDVASSSG